MLCRRTAGESFVDALFAQPTPSLQLMSINVEPVEIPIGTTSVFFDVCAELVR